jgi:hypothetical protein
MANPQQALRSLDAWVMYTTISTPKPLAADGAGIIAQINLENSVTLLARQVTVGPPVDTPSGDARFNTQVTLDSIVGQGYKGQMVVRYNRASIAGRSVSLSNIDLGSATTIYGALAVINAGSGMVLTQNDVEDGPIDPEASMVELTVKSGSYFFTAGSKVMAGKQLPSFAALFSDPIIRWS